MIRKVVENSVVQARMVSFECKLGFNWLEIVHYAVFTADGIPVFQYAKMRILFCFPVKLEKLIQ